jgi:poly-gamma-glutamate system protein
MRGWKIHCLLTLIFLLTFGALPILASAPKLLMTKAELQRRMHDASSEMSRVLSIAHDGHLRWVGPIDKDRDPNLTGLIGPDDSPIVSTQGQLAAKRTACVPDFAALVTRWLYEVGVQPEDKVAVVATGSFPGFNIAAISAIRAIGAQPVIQFSIAASEWGMTEPNYTLLDLNREIRNKIKDWPDIDVVTFGAGGDRGFSLPPNGKKTLERAMRRNDKSPFVTRSLHEQIAERLKLLEKNGPYRAIIFIGGNIAALGTEEMKDIGAGLLPRNLKLDSSLKESMMKEYLMQGVPVIYLHFSEHLAHQWEIPFDPVPLPKPGTIEKIFDIDK